MTKARLKALLHNRYFIVSATVFGAFIFYVVLYFALVRPILSEQPISNQTDTPSSETTPEATTTDNQPADSSAGSSTPSTSKAKSNSGQTTPAPQSTPTASATPQVTATCNEALKAQGLATKNAKLDSSQATLNSRIASINAMFNGSTYYEQKLYNTNLAMSEFYARNNSANTEYSQLLASINCT